MIEWAPIGAKAAEFIAEQENRNKLAKWYNLLTKKRKTILLLGSSGGGKSQFVDSLAQRKGVRVVPRTHETEPTKINLFDNPIQFRDTPGHINKKQLRRDELDSSVRKPIEGIINVVSYGYHEAPKAGREIAVKNKEIDLNFLKTNRDLEIEQVSEWITRISPNKNVKWIINLVTKADLWWDEYDDVIEYYENGKFGQKIKGLGDHMPIYTLPYCSIIKPFFNLPTSGHFGDIEKEALKNVFLQTLINRFKNK